MKTTIIKTLVVGRLAILTMATFLLLTMPGYAEDEAAKNSIREVQQALNGCGFNAGAIDGDFGKRTTQAAAAFVRAHGGNPNTGDKTLLLAQVDFYRAGDAGPCPPEGTEAEATASNESEPAGEAGSVTAEAGSVEADQGEEVEINRESELIAEIAKELDGKRAFFSYDIKNYPYPDEVHESLKNDRKIAERKINVSGETVTEEADIEEVYVGNDHSRSYVLKFKLSDIEEIRINHADSPDEYISFYCSDCIERHMEGGNRRMIDHLSEHSFMTGAWEEVTPGDVVQNFDFDKKRIIEIFEQLKTARSNTTTGQPVKCYNWVNLGTFNLGKWRNGNGRETSGLPAGSGIKIWDDEDLLKDYKASRQHCVSSANGAMDSAVSAMVLIGRQASDVDNEKKRIRSFYKASLDKCLSEFHRRYRKYQNKFCE